MPKTRTSNERTATSASSRERERERERERQSKKPSSIFLTDENKAKLTFLTIRFYNDITKKEDNADDEAEVQPDATIKVKIDPA